jgi:hypothetical protein
MKPEALTGVWNGFAQNSSGWEMEITISSPSPFQAGEPLGSYDIPIIPCSGTCRVLRIPGETLELQAEDPRGDCGPADLDSLTLQSDGTILYLSKGNGWETRGRPQRLQNP